MKIEKIGNRNVIFRYDITDWSLNLHLIMGQKYNYIIDTGLGLENTTPVKEYLGDSKKPIIVINTHYHWDHITGNDSFSDNTIISHKLCRDMMAENWSEMLNKINQYVKGEAKLCLPNLVFEDSIFFPDDKIRIFYTPGHTIDSISVFDEEDRVLNVGDNIGDTIDNIVPILQTDKELYLKSLHKYMELNINACVSGHNTILGKDIFTKIEKALFI